MSDAWTPDPSELAERELTEADEVSWAFREANRAASELDAALARRLGLKHTDYEAMGHLMSTREPLGPNGLAQRLGITAASATELVDRLESAGHLSRERSTTDRRRVELHATPESVARIITELQPLFAGFDDIAQGLSETERAVVTTYLRAVSRETRRFIDDELKRADA
ncbi:MarR family winged helix-turn-helix transcriptional regulator [Marisediminicola sp. LYQ85]|uniref:MarR family winged helix-turn-helix transcriptional regulator n=1 Tax=Marisediminicola sp. LYQ85 TaxID=3391062 RepID=UPI0039839306